MSRLEQSMEKALKMRDRSLPVRRPDPLPPEVNDHQYAREEQQPHLRDYLEILMRRKSIVLVFLASVLITGTAATFLMTPLYKSSTTMQLKSGTTELVAFKDVYIDRRDSETQYKVLQSKSLANRVAKKIPEDKVPDIKESAIMSSAVQLLAGWIPALGEKFKESEEPEEPKAISAGAIMSALEIEPIKKTDLVQIHFTSEDPEFAAYAANIVAEEYINFVQESKLKPSQAGAMRLRKEVEEMRIKLEASEKQLNEYVAKSRFMITKNDKDYENILAQKFTILSESLNDATSERITKEAIYQEVKKSGIDYKEVLEKPIIQSLIKDYIALEAEYSRLLLIHKPEYPRMVQLKEQIDNRKARIKEEERTIVNALHNDYKMALKKEMLLSDAIEKLRTEVTGFQKNMIQFQILKREVETNREMYDSLHQRLKEVEVGTALTENDVQILDRAQVPRSPYKPKKAYNIVLSLIFGLFGGVFLAFFVEYFDNTVKNEEDIERISRLPVIGKVPKASTGIRELADINSLNNSTFTESFRAIGTRLQFSNVPRQILITSSLEQEGKTLVSVSIAMSLISSQGKGIIVDADLRRPYIHSFFGLDNSTGLSSFLSGSSEYEGLIKKSPYAGLDVITAGPVPVSPSELLNSSRMRDLTDSLSAAYDYVIFDSPPVLGMSDSLILSTVAEGVIVVVKANSTQSDALTQTINALKSINSRTVGVILNSADDKSQYAYSSYYYSAPANNNGGRKKLG